VTRFAAATIALALSVACGPIAPLGSSGGSPPAGHYPGGARASRVYVTDYCKNAIFGFPAQSNGSQSPIIRIAGANTTLKNPFGLYVDTVRRRIYVANTGTSSVLTFPINASGNVKPSSTISGPVTSLVNPEGVYVDDHGNIWVANTGAPSPSPSASPSPSPSPGIIDRFAPGANGNVAPQLTIAGANTKLNNPGGLWEDSAGDLWVANYTTTMGSGMDAVIEFLGASVDGATGLQNVAPNATITNSGAFSLESLYVDTQDNVWTTSFGKNGAGSILEFADGTTGTVTSAPAIAGMNTGIGTATGVAVDGQGYIYEASVNEPQIQVFYPYSSGNAYPAQSITSGALACPQGIAIQ
jgi:sugar lactone lactonase YvrE